VIRARPEDFLVNERLGFEPEGEGEHVFLRLQKRLLNSMEVVEKLSRLSGAPPRDIGLSGLKDRNAVTRQWFSVGMAGRSEPDWRELESTGDVRLLAVTRHRRKLRRGVHKGNRFSLVLREVRGDAQAMEQRLRTLRDEGFPNYFGGQRFGRDGATLVQARRWMAGGAKRLSRNRRGLYLSALRAFLFNQLLAERVAADSWNKVLSGDVCLLQGTRSQFACDKVDEDIRARAAAGDVHPGLPLWGRGESPAGPGRARQQAKSLTPHRDIREFLEGAGLDLAWRPARALVDDFSWQFCDDGSLQLDFALGAGAYATALLAEFVQVKEGLGSDESSE
jgi:tRNA pseudouridine13 synthase